MSEAPVSSESNRQEPPHTEVPPHAVPLLNAIDVEAGYFPGVNILNGMTLHAEQGELIGIIGPNGAGKSTFLKAVFGLVQVRSGTMALHGHDITGLRADELVRRSLSGGERQMVAMSRALMMSPSLLLLDEPSAGLSPALQDEVFLRVKEINATGVTIVMVEQNARRCLQIVDRGYVLDQGRNAYEGTGRELANDPKVIELYLGSLSQA